MWRMPPTVLVADDDRVVTLALSAALRAHGYRVVVAHDVVQATMMVRREKPDAVVMDIQMPGGTGLVAIERIRASSLVGHLPVVAISSLPAEATADKAQAAGADAFLPKPVDHEQLIEVLRQRLGA